MFGHALLGALIAGRAVEHAQAVLVPGEVCRDPVDDDADALGVQLVHKIHEVLRSTVTARGCEEARHLVAPAAVIGVFRDGQQLDVGVVHIFEVLHELVRDAAVVGKHLAVFLPP